MLSSKADLSVLLNGTQTNKIAVYEGIENTLKRKTLTSKNVENLIQFFKKVLSDGSDGDKEELFRRWMGFSKNSKRLCVELIQEICNGVWNQSIVKEIVGSLIVNQTLDLGECFKQINNDQLCHKVIETLIQISSSIPLKPYLNFIHISTIRNIFDTQDDSTCTLLCLFVLRVVKSVEFGLEACDEQIRIYVLDNFKNVYVMIIEDLRKSNNRIWYDLCIFTFRYFGKLMHNEIGLLNTLLSNIENGFKSKIVEDKILSFQCWKVLIEVASLDRNYLCSSKQLKLLIKPLKVKLSRNDSVTQKRLEVWLYLLTALQENSLQCLDEFMNFCFEAETSIVKDVWLQRTEVFMNIIGHCETGDCCVSPRTFTLNQPLIDEFNILKYKKAVLNALTICSENILIWEIKAGREKKIRCMWISILRIISALHSLDKELMLRDLFAVIASFWTKNKENREYFDDILQPIFNILSNLDSESFDCLLLNEIIVFPMAQLMLNTQNIPEYIALSFVNLLRSCSKTGSVVEYLNRSCELLRSYFQNKTQVLSAYIWLELANGMLNVCRSPKDYRFEEFIDSLGFLMCWICQCQISKNLEKIICDKWISIMTEIDVICKDFNDTVILKHFQKLLKENPSFASNILGFIPFSIEKINERSSITYVTNVLDIVLQILTIPCLNKNKVPLVLPIISKISEIIGKAGNQNEHQLIISKLFECIEYLLKPHQVYEVLILLKKAILPKLSQSAKKRLPLKLYKIINDLTTHSIGEVSKNAILLMADLNTQRLSTLTTDYRTPSVSSRTAKIASLASANQKPLNLFAQTVQNSPVTVKGSVINNMSTPKSSRSLKIANAMPTFTKPNSINDANSKDFVYIDSEVKVDYSKMVSHQKEVLKRRKEDIPALYQDLSQSQHSYDSLSRSNDILNVENEQKIPKDKSNVIILSNVILSPKRSVDNVESKETSDEAKPNGSDSLTSETDLSNLYVDENSVDEDEGNEDKLICQNNGNQTIKKRRGRKSKKEKEKQIDADKSEIKKGNIKSIPPTVKTKRSSVSRSNEPNGTKTEYKNEIDLNISDNANEEKSSNLDETDCSVDLIAQINNQLKDKKVVRVMKNLKMDIVGGDKLSQLDTFKERLRNKRNTPNKEFTNDKINKLKEKNKVYKANIPINNENNSENIVETQELTEELKMNAIPEENKKSKESPQKQHKNEIPNESTTNQSNIEIGEGHNDEVNASLKNNSQESNNRVMKKGKRESVNVNEERISNLDETSCNIDLITQTNNQIKDNKADERKQKNKTERVIKQLKMDIVGAEKFSALDNSKQRLRRRRISNNENNSENIGDSQEVTEQLENKTEHCENMDDTNEPISKPSNLSLENQSNIEIGEGHNDDVTKSLKNDSQESNGKIMKKKKKSVNVDEEKRSNLDESLCNIDLITQTNNPSNLSLEKQSNIEIGKGQNDDVTKSLRNDSQESNGKIMKKRKKKSVNVDEVKRSNLTESLCNINLITQTNNPSNLSLENQSNIEFVEGHNDDVTKSLKNNSQESNGKIMRNKKTHSLNVDKEKRLNLDETLCNIDLITQTNNPSNLSLENQSNIEIGEGHNDDVTKSLKNNSQESDGKIMKKRKKHSVKVDKEKRSNLDETLCNIDLITQTNNQFKSNKVDEGKQKNKTKRVIKQLKMDIVGAEKLSMLDNSKQRLRRRRITPRKMLKKANIQPIFPINNENNSENIVDTQELTNGLKMNTFVDKNNELTETPQTPDENEMKDNNKSIDLNESISNPSILSLENYSNIKIEKDRNHEDNTNFKNSLQNSDNKTVKENIEISRLRMNIVGANSFVGVTQKRNSNMRRSDIFKSLIGVKRRRRSDSNVNNNVKRRRRSKKIDLEHNKKENETEDILSECLLIQSTNKTNEDKNDENVAKIDEDIIENSQPQNESIFHFSKSGIKLTKNSVIKNESNSPAYITFLPLLFSPSKDKNDTVCCGTNNLIDTNGSSLKECLDRHANKCNENTLLIDLPDTPDISISIDFEAQNTNNSNEELSTKSLESTKLSPKSFINKVEQNTNQLKQQYPNTIIMSLNEINKGKASVNIDLRNERKSSTLSPSVIALRDSDESNLFDQINSNNINKLSPNNQSTNESKRRSSMESLKSSDDNKICNSAVSSDLIIIESVLNHDRNQTTTKSSPKKSPFISNTAKDLEQKSSTVESTLSDTLSCDPNNSISITIQEVSLPVEPTKIEVPKTTLNPLENITLDDFPTGLNKNDEQNLPGSPILENRNFELLNNTVDISPIKFDDEGLKENNEIENKVEPEIINNNLDSENCKIDSNSDFKFELPNDIVHFKSEIANNFMKAPSSRSIKLMNLLPQQSAVNLRKSPKSVNSIRKQCTSVNGSPTSTERVRRMMLNCNGNKSTSLEGEKDKVKNDEKFETINVLEFRRNVPSPFATPNRSILKRKACEALEYGLSPGPKRKRVNFSDPPTTAEKMYYKEETEENDYSVKTRKSTPIYPPLINCPNDIKEVLKLINEDNNFYDNFISLKLTTVGDLAKLSSTRVNQMEFLSNPKISTIINALSAFEDKYNSKDKLEEQVERSMIPSEDPSLPVNGDTENNALLVSPFERLERLDTNISDMWQNLKNLCTRQQLMLISEDLQEYLGPN